MLKRVGSWGVPTGSFVLAIALAMVAGSPPHAMLLRRQAGGCTGADIPQNWEKSVGRTKVGELAAKRAGETITLTFEKLAKPQDTKRDAAKQCKAGTTDVCIEVFNVDGPDGGVEITADTTFNGVKVKKGSKYCAHYKDFVLTPCEGGTVEQIVKKTVTKNGKISEKESDKNFGLEEINSTGVPGPGFFAFDAPGTVIPVGFKVKKTHVEVNKGEFKTFFTCGGNPVCVVVWEATTTITLDPEKGNTSKTTSVTPVIYCAGSTEFDEAKKLLDAAKK